MTVLPEKTIKGTEIKTIPISQIQIPKSKQRRPYDTALLESSLQENDQIVPVLVNRSIDRISSSVYYILVDGRHRLESAKKLGRTMIRAQVEDLDPETTDKLRIISNLVRNDPTLMESCFWIAKLFPRYKHNAAPAAALGISERSKREYAEIGRSLDDPFYLDSNQGERNLFERMNYSEKFDEQKQLSAITAIKDENLRRKIIEGILSSKYESVEKARAELEPKPLAKDQETLEKASNADQNSAGTILKPPENLVEKSPRSEQSTSLHEEPEKQAEKTKERPKNGDLGQNKREIKEDEQESSVELSNEESSTQTEIEEKAEKIRVFNLQIVFDDTATEIEKGYSGQFIESKVKEKLALMHLRIASFRET